jgi:hypothetical protein
VSICAVYFLIFPAYAYGLLLLPIATLARMGLQLSDLELKKNRWAYFFCAVSAIGALVYGYDNTYYNGVLGMRPFKDHYGDHYDKDGKKR